MTTSRDVTDRASAPRGVEEPDSGRPSFLRLPSRLALTSIRTRILVGFVVMLAIATVASVVVAREVLQSRLQERIDDDLAQEVKELRRISAGNDPATGRPFGQRVGRIFRVYFNQNSPSTGEVVLTFVKGSPFLRSRDLSSSYQLDTDAPLLSRWKTLKDPERGSVDTPAGRVEYLAVPMKGDGRVLGTFVVAAFTDVLQHPYNDALVATGVVGLAVLLIGSLLAWRMAESVLRPVSALTQTAQSISETDLTQRIEVRGHDELAGLAATLNAMLDRLERTLSSQRRFLDDAGHELRTPITIIRGHLELLEEDPEERRGDVGARDGRARPHEPHGQRPHPAFKSRAPRLPQARNGRSVGADRRAADAKRARWEHGTGWLDAHGDGVVVADRQRLTQALMQLAQNAVDHTHEGVRISIGSRRQGGEARFWVRDEGPGIAPADQATVFDRFERRGARSRMAVPAWASRSCVRSPRRTAAGWSCAATSAWARCSPSWCPSTGHAMRRRRRR